MKRYIRSSMSEEDQLNQAILDGRPFDIETFRKYKVDPFHEENSVRAEQVKVGDIIMLTDSDQLDYGTEVEILDINPAPDDWSDIADYEFTVRVVDIKDSHLYNADTGETITDGYECPLYYARDEWVGALMNGEAINSASDIKRYSDVRPYEDRKYWYFTTHGVGPGTIPKDLTVLETREGQNEKGTWGTFVCLDGVLNTDELSYYDLKELAPDNITSAEDIEDNEDEWSPYHGHNYMVCAGPYNELTFHCDDPKRAITYWFKYNKKYPTEVAVMCPTKELAMKLVKAGTPKLLTSLEEKFGCPYKLDWLIDECKRKSEDGCKGFYEGEYGDTVHPFGVG